MHAFTVLALVEEIQQSNQSIPSPASLASFRISCRISSKMNSITKLSLLAAAANAAPQFGPSFPFGQGFPFNNIPGGAATTTPAGPSPTCAGIPYVIPGQTIQGFTFPPYVTIPAFTIPGRTLTLPGACGPTGVPPPVTTTTTTTTTTTSSSSTTTTTTSTTTIIPVPDEIDDSLDPDEVIDPDTGLPIDVDDTLDPDTGLPIDVDDTLDPDTGLPIDVDDTLDPDTGLPIDVDDTLDPDTGLPIDVDDTLDPDTGLPIDVDDTLDPDTGLPIDADDTVEVPDTGVPGTGDLLGGAGAL
ncbi:hypothetical protein BST61_g3876 [Cercospora zeina]